MRILVADDDTLSREALVTVVAGLGHEVLSATNGAEALALLEDRNADIRMAMLDWTMPRLDGPQVCTRVRARDGHGYTYLILVSARTKPQHVIEGLDSGADDYITKPIQPLEVHARIRAGERVLGYQARLATYQAYLDKVVASLDSGVMLSERTGRVVFANETLARLAGVPSHHSVGRLREEILALHVQHAPEPIPFLQQMINAGAEPVTVEVELALQEPRTLSWTTKEVPLPNGPARLDVCRDITAEVRLARILADKASHDHLTGLLNRHGGDEAIKREVARASRRRTALSLVLVDIDHFKRVNDTHGHGVGDRVLQATAHVISSQLRLYDHAIRWGGEELLVVLPETSGFQAVSVAERLRKAVSEHSSPNLPQVTVSIGVSEVRDGDTTAALGEADAALYRAKSAGRNCVRRNGDDATTLPPRVEGPTPQ